MCGRYAEGAFLAGVPSCARQEEREGFLRAGLTYIASVCLGQSMISGGQGLALWAAEGGGPVEEGLMCGLPEGVHAEHCNGLTFYYSMHRP